MSETTAQDTWKDSLAIAGGIIAKMDEIMRREDFKREAPLDPAIKDTIFEMSYYMGVEFAFNCALDIIISMHEMDALNDDSVSGMLHKLLKKHDV